MGSRDNRVVMTIMEEDSEEDSEEEGSEVEEEIIAVEIKVKVKVKVAMEIILDGRTTVAVDTRAEEEATKEEEEAIRVEEEAASTTIEDPLTTATMEVERDMEEEATDPRRMPWVSTVTITQTQG